MKIKISMTNKNGFSLLEITVILIVISILLSAVIPVLSRAYLEKAATKTALDIQNIQDAARGYYLKYNAWPSSIIPVAGQIPPQDLESNGYLPSYWNGLNPFLDTATGTNYPYTVSTSGSDFFVSTIVADGAQNIVSAMLSTAAPPSGLVVTSSIPPPGASTQTPYYDSGWFYLAQSSQVTLNHYLNTTNFTYTIWCSTSSVGSNAFTLLQSSYGSTRGIVIRNVTSTSVEVVSSIPSEGGDSFWSLDGSGNGIQFSGLYCRVILTVIP